LSLCTGIVIRGQGIDEELRVNVKDIVAHGSADRDGRVTPGDNILAIQGINVLQLGSLEVCRKHLKGPSGTSVRIDIGKASGETLSVTLERGNAGYWALYDTLHKANLDIVSLKRELADAQLAVKKASDDADDVRKLSVDAEEKTRTAINLKREFETRCENLKSQTEELLETIQQQDVKIYAANTAKRLAEADKDHAVIEAKDLTDQLEVEKRRAMKACERAVQCEKDLVDETDQKLALSKEVQRLKMLCRDVEDRIRHEAAADLASMRSRAEQAEAAVLRLEREMASRQSVIEGLHADLTGARTSEATLTERLSVSEADRSRCMHELEVKAAQVESVTRASTEANAASEQAQAEARMHKLATKSLQERVVSLERECMDDKAKVADMLVRVNNLQQEKIEIEHLLQDTSKVAAAYVTDIATLRVSSPSPPPFPQLSFVPPSSQNPEPGTRNTMRVHLRGASHADPNPRNHPHKLRPKN
jgi:chromosome segregation ATPase